VAALIFSQGDSKYFMITFKQFFENLNDRVFYHVTSANNIPSILKNGLVPQIGNRSAKIHEDQPEIFMFADIASLEDAMQNWLLDEFDEDEPLKILKITLPENHPISKNGSEITTTNPISPNNIEITEMEI
jgi:hypothetical protein